MIDNANPQVETLKSQIQSQKQILAELTAETVQEPDGAKFDRGQYGDPDVDLAMDELTLTPAAVQSDMRASSTSTDSVRMLSRNTRNSSD
jgi:hypothetical protein